jgi:mono/diheme cytochrome c family protein
MEVACAPGSLVSGHSNAIDDRGPELTMTTRLVLGPCFAMCLSSIAMAAGGGPSQIAPQAQPSPIPNTSPANGRQMFLTHCAPCHGRDGKGDGPAAKSLQVPPSDLTRISARHDGVFPLMRVRQHIEGLGEIAAHGSREMPIWGSLFIQADGDAGLKELRINNLANYVKALQK